MAGGAGAAAVGAAAGVEAAAGMVLVAREVSWGDGDDGPGVAGRVDGGEGNAAVENLQPGLVFEHEGAGGAGRHGLREADDGIVRDDSALGEEGGQGGGGRSEQAEDERLGGDHGGQISVAREKQTDLLNGDVVSAAVASVL